MEEDFSSSCSPLQGDAGKELLRHLLKDKLSPATTPSPRAQTPPTARCQLSNENVHSEEEDRLGSQGTMVSRVFWLCCGPDDGPDVDPNGGHDNDDDGDDVPDVGLTHFLLPPPGEQPGPSGVLWQEEGSTLQEANQA